MAMAKVLQLLPPATPLDDGMLVERALGGADWAKRELYQRHAPRVLGFLTRLLGSTADAEDASQDAFVEAFRDLPRLREARDFGRWVIRIAVHQAHRRFRRRRLLSFIGLDTPELDASLEALADERASAEHRAELALLQKVLARMPAQERIAWVLRHVEGYELTEVADALSVSLATAKSRLTAADTRIAAVTGVTP
jgi:RNA polymerase sigma-70 factor (ECF subfamily)